MLEVMEIKLSMWTCSYQWIIEDTAFDDAQHALAIWLKHALNRRIQTNAKYIDYGLWIIMDLHKFELEFSWRPFNITYLGTGILACITNFRGDLGTLLIKVQEDWPGSRFILYLTYQWFHENANFSDE